MKRCKNEIGVEQLRNFSVDNLKFVWIRFCKCLQNETLVIPKDIAKRITSIVSAYSIPFTEEVSYSVESKRLHLDFKAFTKVRKLGDGAFGEVQQYRHKLLRPARDFSRGNDFVVKTIDRPLARKMVGASYVEREIEILSFVTHPFILELYAHFTKREKTFLMLEFLDGLDLFHFFEIHELYPSYVKLVVASIIDALGYLHTRRIIHRDIKMENILIDKSTKYVKLSDFGISKKLEGARTMSYVGTLPYMAPEVIMGNGHSTEVDYWSVGALLYEFTAGEPPFAIGYETRVDIVNKIPNWEKFRSSDKLRIFLNTLQDESKIKYEERVKSKLIDRPYFFDRITGFDKGEFLLQQSVDLVKKLLEKKPSLRLGASGGIESIKADGYFVNVDWKALRNHRYTLPGFLKRPDKS